MGAPRSKTRGWLIFAGIFVLALALPLLRFKGIVLFSRLAVPVVLIALVLLAMSRLIPKKPRRDKHREEP